MTNKELRMERKFEFPKNILTQDVEGLIQFCFAGFKEQFWKRKVNNIYFDTPDLDLYYDNLDGSPDKHKVRLRWYDGKQDCMALELKSKNGYVTAKQVFTLSKQEDIGFGENLGTLLARSPDIPAEIKEKTRILIPVLQNSYFRKYYLSACGRFRLTLDTQISYSVPAHKVVHQETHNVMEIKHQQEYQQALSPILQQLPFRMTKFSKYARGIEAMYG